MNDQGETEHRRIGGVMQALAWMSLLAFGVFFFSDVLEKQHNPNQAPETRQGSNGGAEVVLQRNRFGHYVTAGEINGQPVTFMLDTGATMVAVPAALARKLGLASGRAITYQTANGSSTGFAAMLDSVSVGGIRMNDVRAGITPGLEGEEVLLGMSFLKNIDFTQRGNTLTLRQ
ncbi:MAG: TIGR02281 family clan AA aspartic protease [Halioglobus sp.]